MDKSNKPKGVTIKINGEEKEFKNNRKEPENQGDERSNPELEKPADSFEWILPDDSIDRKAVLVPAPPKKKVPKVVGFNTHKVKRPNGKGLKTALMAIVCAVFFGSVLGLVAVKVITKEKEAGPALETAAIPDLPVQSEQTKSAEGSSSALKAYLVQGGIFSSEEAAEQVRQKITEKNVPAEILKLDDSYYIFLGTAGSLEASKELAVFLKTYDVDVFWKELDLKASEINDSESASLETMKNVYQSLAGFSAAELTGGQSQAKAEDWKQDLAKLDQQSTAGKLADMKESLQSASENLTEYQDSKSKEKLFEVQASLLEFLKKYQASS